MERCHVDCREEAVSGAALEPATSKAPPTANFHSISQLYFLFPKLVCFPPTLRNDFMLMAEWSREKWDSLEFPFPASSQFSRERRCNRTANSASYFANVSCFWGFSHQGGQEYEHAPLTPSSLLDRKGLLEQIWRWWCPSCWSSCGRPALSCSSFPVELLRHAEGHTPPHITCDETWFSLTCRNFSLCLLWPKNHRMS